MANTVEVQITRRKIVNIFGQFSDSNNIEIATDLIKTVIKEDLTDEEVHKLKQVVMKMRSLFHTKWQAASRTKDRFERANSEWLNSNFKVPAHYLKLVPDAPNRDMCARGRPRLPYQEMAERTRRLSARNLRGDHDPEQLLLAGKMAARATGKIDLAYVIAQTLKSPSRPTKLRKVISQTQPKMAKYSAEEGLALVLDCGLSKEQYLRIRSGAKGKMADIYPNYNMVRAAKSNCRPPPEAYDAKDFSVEVKLQAILNHTTIRIITLANEVLLQTMTNQNSTNIKLQLICSWGMDGASGQSMYKQKSSENTEAAFDSNLFVISMIPLRLLLDDGRSSMTEIYWINRTPQSYRFCRPIKISYTKETHDLVKLEYSNIIEQIQELQPLLIEISESHTVEVCYTLAMTLIDGKILCQLTDTNSVQCCPICHAKPSSFNELSNLDSGIFSPDPNSLTFGISPLHAWIRFFECCLHIAYRMSFKKHQARGVELQNAVQTEKKRIKNAIEKELGVIVDQPKPGGSGTTNDGNTARRAFAASPKFAEILGINWELVKRFQIILISLSCELPINPITFGEYCRDTAHLYVSCYKWFPMPATVHKVLVHGAQILANSVLPVGILSEQGLESRHKFYKHDREHHARKSDRSKTTLDIFNRAMDSSDPIISNYSLDSRLKKRKRLNLPIEVLRMLIVPEVCESEESGESESEDEYDTEDATGLSEFYSKLEELELNADEEIQQN